MKHSLYKCSCGAYGIDDGTKEIKWASDLNTLNKITKLNLEETDFQDCPKLWGCDYCCNRWGLDLCKCGSGERVHECSCGCHEPSQTYGKQEVRALWVY